ncbi:MAG TPA: RIP metalloprotease RseP [Rubrobacteraceae bacterium]|jgi:regulator of sigma E protease|nr:RIP metalloprotease RseP [Rubrobacteraceae bacterium]
MTILIAILGLIALIVIHELGHMLVAKALGVRVPEFGIGFGPTLWKKKFGKTVYSLRLIQLGGFVKMAGMNDDDTGPDTYPEKAAWRRALIIFAGPFANLLAAVLILAAIFMAGVPTGATTEIEEVVSGSMAAEAGVQGGDQIVAVNGEETESWEGFQEVLSGQSPGDRVDLVVDRGGEQQEFSGDLAADPQNPERAIVGVRPVLEYTSYGPMEALWLGAQRTVEIIGLFGWFIGQLVTGEVSFFESVSGPVGITSVGSDAVSQGTQSFGTLLALISINLAVMNLLPMLPLDGGHLFFIAAEKVMGRPVSTETLAKIAAFGIALVLMLMVFAIYADLSKIFTGQPFIPEQRP